MKLQFFKNVQFTKLMKAEGRLREFNFRRYGNALQKTLFSIDTTDDRGNRIVFDMCKQEDSWRIAQTQLPIWILENENNFRLVIETEAN
ncbi:MAG: hypothetical protein U0V75_05740 [Ferruginibacter sp.]